MNTKFLKLGLVTLLGTVVNAGEDLHSTSPLPIPRRTSIPRSGLQWGERAFDTRPVEPPKHEAITKSGHRFVRDRSNPELGNAWKDAHGIVWGDLVRNRDGSPRMMNHSDASAYCRKIGARLPTRKELVSLSTALGGLYHKPEVLPHLEYSHGAEKIGPQFWSSTMAGTHGYTTGISAYTFHRGWVTADLMEHKHAVRCIIADSDIRTTTSGHRFIREYSNEDLGEAWRDPSGMIWGDIVRYRDGKIAEPDKPEAVRLCKEAGGELPTAEDFERLRSYFGATVESEKGFAPQVLPNFGTAKDAKSAPRHFWTRTPPHDQSYAFVFDDRMGKLFTRHRLDWRGLFVRCVVPPAKR